MSEKKILLKILAVSVVLYLAICWIHMFPMEFFALARPLCFFAFTYYCFYKCKDIDGIKKYQILIAVCIGSILPEIPVRILDYYGTLFTIPVPAYTMLSIILAGWCFTEKKASVFVASMFIMLLLCTFILREWTTWYHQTH